ncbi:MAG: ABC transporter ATP-binding protein, partial [Ostreibacterium sp.]
LGRSGCGKSSLLKAIAGLQNETIQSGQITLNASMAYMAQQDALLPWLSVLDNIKLVHRLHHSHTEKTHQQANVLLEQVGLSDKAQCFPYQLSGGQRQRVALARTLMRSAELILMDEPFSAVDAITRLELQTLAAQLLADKTVILITHDPVEAIRLVDQIYIIKNAGLNAHFTPSGERPRLIHHEYHLRLQQQILSAL